MYMLVCNWAKTEAVIASGPGDLESFSFFNLLQMTSSGNSILSRETFGLGIIALGNVLSVSRVKVLENVSAKIFATVAQSSVILSSSSLN